MESILNDFLMSLKISTVEWDRGFDWCKKPTTGNKLRFDFVLVDLKILIELDGEQHFNDVKHFNSLAEEEQSNDVYKMLCAIENSYSVIRITQIDVKQNKNNWKTKLTILLQNINTQIPAVYYVDRGNLYDNHKKKYSNAIKN